MAISFKKYIDITSSVGGSAAVRERDLILRIFTTNNLVPPNSLVEMDSADDVLDYFGSSSEEYKRASFYFGWISKQTKRAKKIAFSRYVHRDSLPMIYGVKSTYSISKFQAVTNGTLTLMLGVTNSLVGLDFSAAASLSDVASILKTAINSQASTGWSNANVVYDAVNSRFMLIGGATGNIEVNAAGDVADLLGWGSGAIHSDGALTQTPLECVAESAEFSNNFASFLYMDALSLEQTIEIADWNKAQNVMYMYTVRVNKNNAQAYSAALLGYSGVTLTLAPNDDEFDEMVPAIIMAATDYFRINSTQNYMFQQFSTLTPKVTKTAASNTYDAERVNYYGQTQTAGQNISFYQRGVMMGGSNDLVDQNIYANEIWLKDAVSSRIMSLLLSVSKVSANDKGRSQLIAVIQGRVNQAKENGVISLGKELNDIQKLYIAELTGDDNAYLQVQNTGYWLDCEMQTTTTQDGRIEYKAVYTLIYSKDDVIRKVEGTHTLI